MTQDGKWTDGMVDEFEKKIHEWKLEYFNQNIHINFIWIEVVDKTPFLNSTYSQS